MSLLKYSTTYISMLVLLLLSFTSFAANKQTELDNIRNQIKVHTSTIQKQNAYLDNLSKQTKKTDRAISKVAAQIENTSQLIKQIEADLNALVKQEKALQNKKRRQQNILAAQVETAYLTGENDYLKLLLNQQNTSEIERSLVYYEHVNKARATSIDRFNNTLTEIEKNKAEQVKIQAQLSKIKTHQLKQAKSLEQQKQKQKRANRNIAKILRTENKTLAELKRSEKQLTAQLKKIQKRQKPVISLSGLRQYKGRLNWPVKGNIIHSYGSKRFSDVRWQGMVIKAREGSKVRAVSAGKVVFADWLRGYGMVTVIDHGKGYMSLYGHNQTLLKTTGEKVSRGEAISLAGRSGGQLESGLYFEIRYKGKALNPKPWLKR